MKILAGPAVRYSQTEAVAIWLVTDQRPGAIQAVARLDPTGANIADSQSSPQSRIVKVAENAYVCLLVLQAQQDTLPSDKKIYYDIDIDGQRLKDFALLNGEQAIVYPGESLPSFFLPTEHYNILHGSCRKPHAGTGKEGQFDMLWQADTLLATQINTLAERPSMLVLSGDQIYADDVASPLLAALIEQARTLMGGDESLPSNVVGETLVPATIALGGRQRYVDASMGFTSTESKNHLMTFGEYLAMYLVVWGGLKIRLPEYDDVRRQIAWKTVKRGKYTRRHYAITRSEYENERLRVNHFLAASWKVRRLLANVSSYMIFDDHDVTDDWNLDRQIADRLRTKAMSRRIVSNALAAYWACQGWGNAPEKFSHLSSVVTALIGTTQPVSGSETAEEARLFDQSWGYCVEGKPAMVVLDTRTHRDFSGAATVGLLSRRGFEELSENIKQLAKDTDSGPRQSLLLVSPAPVFGFTEVELLQLQLAQISASKVDAESWMGNDSAFRQLLKTLMALPVDDCLILSGDVHYGFNRRKVITSMLDGSDIRLTQLTASALCNRPGSVGNWGLRTLARASEAFRRGSSHYLLPSNGGHQFINGNVNIGQIRLDDSGVKDYLLHYYDYRQRTLKRWHFDLQLPPLFS